MDNPYLDELLKHQPLDYWLASAIDKLELLMKGSNAFECGFARMMGECWLRQELMPKYSWGIPSEEAIRLIARFGKIIEIGAGTGYWSYLLRQLSVDVVAYDPWPYTSQWCNYKWTEVLKGDHNKIPDHPDRTLFMCWPPHNSPVMRNCLEKYTGEFFIYVGEINGATSWWKGLAKEWELNEEMTIPQYDGLNDCLMVWKRK